ncbi:hypothetical protein CEP51_005338 [Fusarium floridanum]|uniref:Uncharacterized protein n=1 Tax=Fusarium floridanum TaxID=1325733 RepID=A0A428RX94_9HYPO|nr:hypothetical protein CEP51_005338 [Fusarium floridanum]
MEPVSLALGILPVIGGSIGAYKATVTKLKIFCHYSREVKRLRQRFDLPRVVFLNEAELLLSDVLKDKGLAKSMVDGEGQSRWDNSDLEVSVRDHMGRSLDSFKDVMEEIETTIAEFQDGLSCFRQLEVEKQEDESAKDAVKRLKKRVKITFRKDKFDDLTSKLKRSNKDLERIRKQAHDINTKDTVKCVAKTCCKVEKPPPRHFPSFGSIRRASRALHEALLTAWSNASETHLRHSLRLFLDAEGAEEVRMNLAILCYGHQIAHDMATPEANLIRLRVQSRTLESLSWARPTGLLTPADSTASIDSQQSEEGSRRKRQRVRFAPSPSDGTKDAQNDVPDHSSLMPRCPVPDCRATPDPDVLELSGDICMEIKRRVTRHLISQTPSCVPPCLGHLDCSVEESFRHSFYPSLDDEFDHRECQAPLNPEEVMRMDDILARPVDKRLTIVHQLHLALQIASAVLKFSSTPWLREYWSVRDLYFFHGSQVDELSTSIQTMHFKVDVVNSKNLDYDSFMDIDMTLPNTSISALMDRATRKYGIRNMTLYSLGVVLLAIGQWAPVDLNDVEEVRRLAAEPCRLGPRYQELTQKVLDCDFGYGKDLTKPRLQEAVYENVLLELETMIERLDLSK